MAEASKTKGIIKFVVWGILSVALVSYTWWTYTSGQMINWYYYRAAEDGYAVNVDNFKMATKAKPAVLQIGSFTTITGLQAVKVKKGDLLPKGCNGIINDKVAKDGKRAVLEGNVLKVMVPVEIKESRGFKFKDSFKHKGVLTNQWSGVQNFLIVVGLGLCLGCMAEGFTDMLGIKIKKIKHFEDAH